MNLETFIVIGVGLLIGIDIALLERSNRKLQRQLLELAKARNAGSFTSQLKVECDNSQALASLAEVQLAAERAAATLEKVAAGATH